MAADERTVLLVNPNTNAATTRMMTDLASGLLAGHGLRVLGVSAPAGPAMIVDPAALAEAAGHVHEAVLAELAGPRGAEVAAVVVAAIGDPGRRRLAAELAVPVVGIGQASVLAAARGGRRFGMATSTPLLVDSLTRLVEEHGAAGQFCGVRLTASGPLALAADPERQDRELAEAVEESVADGAEAVVIAGGPLSATARRLAAAGIAEIVEPVPSACRALERVLGEPAA